MGRSKLITSDRVEDPSPRASQRCAAGLNAEPMIQGAFPVSHGRAQPQLLMFRCWMGYARQI